MRLARGAAQKALWKDLKHFISLGLPWKIALVSIL